MGKGLEYFFPWRLSLSEIKGLGYDVEIERFKLPIVIERKDDPIRTWTHPTNSDPLQLINGLQLLINHFFIVVDLKLGDLLI